MVTKNVAYFARITCSCGTSVEVDAWAVCNLGADWNSRCEPEVEHDAPKGWLGGFDEANPYLCPACVAVKYA
jgi:hypothetical protein